ncbi:hypothetical protein JCM1840_003205 [Sporobolomyces johnsonii]
MSGRIRKPTARALESAYSAALVASAPPERRRAPASKASSSSSVSSNAAPVKRNGRAVNAKGKAAVARELAMQQAQLEREEADATGAADEEQGQAEPDLTLYCVCLGYDTGEQPMIQCEHCSNWFHFGCIGLTDDSASKIEAYSCDMCEQMGVGSTRLLPDPTALPSPSAPLDSSRDPHDDYSAGGADADEQLEDDEGEEEHAQDDDDDDFEEEEGAGGSAKKRKRKAAGGRTTSRRKLDQDESDDDYGSSGDDEEKSKKPTRSKAKKGSNRGASVTIARKSSTDVKQTSVPPTEKTRAAVVKQFTTTFSSIFSAASSSAGLDVRAAAFAEDVEGELFEGFCELDDKGVRAPRAKYTSKFRSLQFNLKSNAVFRSRIASNELDAASIVHMSAEDLQTPELKAMAESVRAASLKNAVKEVLVAPTAKRTHKGEEEIDNTAARLVAEEEAALKEMEKRGRKERERERSDSISQAGSPFVDDSSAAAIFPGSPFAGSPTPGSPRVGADSPSAGSFFGSPAPSSVHRPRSSLPTSSLAFTAEGLGHEDVGGHKRDVAFFPSAEASPDLSANSVPPAPLPGSPAVKDEEETGSLPPPPPKHRNSGTNFDMSAIWGKVKAASPPPESPEDAGKKEEESGEPDLFDFSTKAGDDMDDDFEDALFREDGAAAPTKAPPPPLPSAPAPKPPAISELPPVWAGDLLVPDEGGFPSFGVQVGGRPLGASPTTWTKVLPRGLTMAGRISTQQATKYLVECSFAPTRELTVVALQPDLTGPSEHFPHKPNAEKCLAKHARIFDFYTTKDRIGVVQPPKELAKLVKDLYVVPLAKDQALPEYIELLDDHCIPETGKRDHDLILCVIVMQKGVLPTVKTAPLPAPPVPAPAPEHSAPLATSVPFSTSAPFASTSTASWPTQAPAPFHGQPPTVYDEWATPPPPVSSLPPFSHAPPPSGAALAAALPPHPALDPTAVSSLLASVDPTTLSSLLANPSMLANMTATPTPTPMAAVPGPIATSQPLEGGASGGGGGGGGVGYIHPSRLAAMNQGMESTFSGGGVPAGAPSGPRGGAGDGAWSGVGGHGQGGIGGGMRGGRGRGARGGFGGARGGGFDHGWGGRGGF